MKQWKKVVLITVLVLIAITWLLIVSDIWEWWHWDDWMEHIRSNHL